MRKRNQLKRVQKILKTKNERLMSLIDQNMDGVIELDLEGRFKTVNDVFCEISGYSKEELIGQSFNPLIRKEELEDTLANFQKSLHGEAISYKNWIVYKHGHMVLLDVKTIPIIVEKNIEGIYLLVKNITTEFLAQKELVETKEELVNSEEKFRLISEYAFDIIKLVSPTGFIEYISPSIKNITGYSQEDFIGKDFTQFIHPNDRLILEQEYENFINCFIDQSMIEVRIRHRNGHWLWLESSTRVVKINGLIKQFVTIARDITERKESRDQLAQMAFRDYLTKLPNRRLFEKKLHFAIEQGKHSNKIVANAISANFMISFFLLEWSG
jgi:PAS domain S-box-containing protein